MLITMACLLTSAGCLRRDGRNSDCRWPPESFHHSASANHLSADAEFAEDLAIRYADTHYGLHTPSYVSGEAYGSARDRCMQELFEQIAREHSVSVQQVSSSLGRNRLTIDVAETALFLLLYCFVAFSVARFAWRRYSPSEHGWAPLIAMAAFLSVLFAVAGTMAGETWCGLIETFRIGNGHMSYRAGRLLWARHRPECLASLFVLFWLAGMGVVQRFPRGQQPLGTQHPLWKH